MLLGSGTGGALRAVTLWSSFPGTNLEFYLLGHTMDRFYNLISSGFPIRRAGMMGTSNSPQILPLGLSDYRLNRPI